MTGDFLFQSAVMIALLPLGFLAGALMTNANEARRILGRAVDRGVALALLTPFTIPWWSRWWIAQRLEERFRGRLGQI
jgi:hypothetical protein